MYFIKEMVNDLVCSIELWMHLGSRESSQLLLMNNVNCSYFVSLNWLELSLIKLQNLLGNLEIVQGICKFPSSFPRLS